MNDLYVEAAARSAGVGVALVRAREAECAKRKVGVLEWQTARTNTRAQSLYDRGNAERSEWITYTLAVTPR
jgi:GNAT superfamily N-acetyltransferase